MKIDKEKCIGCEDCHPYCPVGAIGSVECEGQPISEIDQDNCLECGICLRSEVCPVDAIEMPELEWPRSIRAAFSNPLVPHKNTKIPGRGTEEMKTNDVTGRFRRGFAGIAVEMGRPGVGTTFRDLQTVSMALAKLGVQFEPKNPVAAIMVDPKTGKIDDEVLDEKALSAIIEFLIESDRVNEALDTLKAASGQIDTVFSATLIATKHEYKHLAAVARAAGFSPRPNTKTNVGLGRPLIEET